MSCHNGVQVILNQCFINQSVGFIPFLYIEIVYIIGQMGVSEVLSVSGEMFGRTGKSGIFMGPFYIAFFFPEQHISVFVLL